MRREPLGTPPDVERQPRLRAHARPAAETGFTLLEMLLGITIALLVAAAVSDFLFTSFRSANAASSRTVAAREAEVFLARLTRDVRQAQRVEVVSANTNKTENKTPVNVTYGEAGTSVSFFLPNPGSSGVGTEVKWSCSTALQACTRAVNGGTTRTELKGVVSATFAPYSASGSELASGAGASALGEYPTSIQLTLKVQVVSQREDGSRVVPGVTQPIIVQDGVSLRNYAS